MCATTLPTSRAFVTALCESLSQSSSLPGAPTVGASSNALSTVSNKTKKQLLSLQVLFPNDFLPALDLLDRGLVTRFIIVNNHHETAANKHSTTTNDATKLSDDKNDGNQIPIDEPIISDAPAVNLSTTPSYLHNTIHYVRSAQQRTSRFTTSYDTTASYEVRLLAWTCSCPAFAFAAFPSMHPELEQIDYNPDSALQKEAQRRWVDIVNGKGEWDWEFGGISMDSEMPPVCKHLLACVLAQRCKALFGDCVEEREVSVDEAAGWAAGWGD